MSADLNLPFFEARHSDYLAEAAAWADAHAERLAHGAEEDVEWATIGLVRELGKAGLLRHAVPRAYGGESDKLDVRSLCLMRETLAKRAGLADFAFAMQGLGTGPITLFGSDAQKAAYLPPVGRGEKVAAFALSEKEAGSDPAALATTAVRQGDKWVLNGTKTWISNGGIADHYVVFARTNDAPGARGLSAFIVDADTEGFSVTEKMDVIAPHPLGTLQFTDCAIPLENMLGGDGEGFKIAMSTLDIFRSTVGAAALGFARRALDEAVSHTLGRELFGGRLFDLQMTQGRLAEMATEVDASALLIYRAAWLKDNGQPRVTREAAMAKMYATEAAQKVADDAVQLFGGMGVTRGNKVEELYREVRALRIYEGATEIQKIVIARQLELAAGG